ncbi:MAG TPA: tRNA (adenosine(37)-N6)-threonylcarbamoyltransferase complex dimerization subunit type 1 TsaB [Gemmatimonadales bacterium]|nr:tRNA (adenosine(37)-N6)-threonylcarbamoyltransferase complex dimerization subunit type 1 TsaB [Gemmatimonadales bacterium]
MTWLALDTATDRASVAIGRTVETAREEHLDGARRHATAVLPMIERLLGAMDLVLDDLRGVIVADGPGSFTGLRVGASIAKALADTRGLPVLTTPSLMARAHAASGGGAMPVVVTSNALRGELYAAIYRFAARSVTTLLAPVVVPAAQLGSLVPAGAADASEFPADARQLIALTALAGGSVPVNDVRGWEPVYGRPAEAQAQWERSHGRPLSSAPGLAG